MSKEADSAENERFKKIEKEREELPDPYEIEFLPEFEEGRGPREAFINDYGVVIGDHVYESPNSPLIQWTEETDPSVMSGDQWVHSFKDVGFQTEENRDYFEKGIPPQGGRFFHPDKDVAYELNLEHYDGEPQADVPENEAQGKET